MTSVSPSQWPRESPFQRAEARVGVRTAVERDDARVVRHLVHDHHVAGRLHDLQVAVVARLQARQAEVHAALAEREDFRIFERVRPPLLNLRGAPLLRVRRHRRKAAVRRIADERRPSIVPVAADDPELVVVAGARIVRARLRDAVQHGVDEAVAELRVAVVLGDLRGEPLKLVDLRVGELRLPFPLLRPLQRRHGVVRPDALKIGMAVRRARQPGRLRADGDGDRCRENEDDGEEALGHVSSAFRVSGIQIHMIAASRNAAPATVNAPKNPRDAASDPTTYGAAALAMRPVL